MRRARPELYSDSDEQTAYKLEATALEQRLDTLTARNQTHDFEIFCRKLCERTICPNLKPATGPEGGGDSKADTETIAVADEIATLTYVGDANGARERWAFAFSAKKTWKAKARADVDGLAATSRGYAKVFVVTSQYARAKDRAELEDTLSSKHGFRVEILDRSWIVSQVLEGRHQDLAVDHLDVGERVTTRRMGPRDFERTQRLDDLEAAIQDPQAYDGMDGQRVSDALAAAKLSRELERPRIETDGRFERAIRLADDKGSFRQRLEARYQRLWTAFYWFDDVDLLDREYDAFAAMALSSAAARDLELVSTLLQNLANAAMHGHREAEALRLSPRSAELVAALQVLAAETERPNNALEARTTLLQIEANQVMIARDYTRLASFWPRFADVLVKAEGLAEYSADRLIQLIEIFGRPAGRDRGYGLLVDQLADFVSRRTGEGESGRILLKRAEQLDAEEDRFELVRLLGKATRQLCKKEYADSLVEATYMLAVAYKGLGMLWAARASAIFAIGGIVADSDNSNDLPASFVQALMLLGWIDLELRLLPEFLDTIRLVRGARSMLPLDELSQARVDDRLEHFDIVLACHLLNFTEEELVTVSFLPDLLGGLGLTHAQGALLYALGHEDIVLGEDLSEATRDDLAEMFTWLADQPAGDLAGRPLIVNDTGAQRIETRVLGMTVAARFEGSNTGHLVAQTILAVIDTLFATTLAARVRAHVHLFTITIEEHDGLTEADYDVDQMRMTARLHWPRGVSPASPSLNDPLHDVMTLLPALILATTCTGDRPLDIIEQLYRDEALAERIATAVASANSRSRAFSFDASRLSEWREMSQSDYALKLDRPGIAPQRLDAMEDGGLSSFDGTQPQPKDHRALEVRSILNFPLWEKAGWDSLLLGVYGPGLPPVLGLHFEDRDIGREIFAEWRERFGHRDEHGDIHLAILRDLPGHPPSHYAAFLTAGMDDDRRRGQITSLTTRIKVLEPDTDINLRRFLEAYDQVGCYLLASAAGLMPSPEIMTDLAILKRDLPVKRLCDITDEDLESIGKKMLMATPA